jgi:cardiolipin synthase A/B
MRITKAVSSIIMLISAIILCEGCSTLPKVNEVINETPGDQESSHILAAQGFLSAKQTKAIMERLKQRVDPTDLLERETAVMESVSGSPLIKGNKVSLLADGPATYAAMFKAVEKANDHINIETFIFEADDIGSKFADLLLQKQSEGVQVNIIYDSVGSSGTPELFFDRLRKGGIQVLEFSPVNPVKVFWRRLFRWQPTHRDHRKIIIVDGKIAFTGGVNISGVYSSGLSGKEEENKEKKMPWRDTDVQIEGPAVAAFQKLFLDTWQKEEGTRLSEKNYFPHLEEAGSDLVQVVASTPGAENRITFIMYVSAIIFSENSAHLANAYFVPDKQMIKALTDAGSRGVDVKMILPKTTDSWMALYAGRYYYADLLKSGVKIYQRRNAMLHAKTAVIDSIWSTVGSTNMDFWSFSRNDEVNSIILSRDFSAIMEKMFAKDLEESDEVKLEEWKERPLFPRLREWLAHLLAHWL